MTFDVAVIGAGPAGISAAIESRKLGLSVLVLDENRAPGGRIWESVEDRARAASPANERPFTAEDAKAAERIAELRRCGATLKLNATVWAIEPGGTILWNDGEIARRSVASRIVVATGTMERPLVIAGWTLPGVMPVGAAQILLKSGGLVPGGDTWVAGQGPLLLLYINQVLQAGGKIRGVVDLSKPDRKKFLRHLPQALKVPSYLLKGMIWRYRIRRSGIEWIRADSVGALGTGKLEQVSFASGSRNEVRQADLLLLHDGVVPQVTVTRALGCDHIWDDGERYWRPKLDEWGQSSRPEIFVTGDAAFVAGADAAILAGRLTALGVACSLGRLSQADRNARAAPLRKSYRRYFRLRQMLQALFPPIRSRPADDTIVCRCEEVTAGELRRAAALGCLGLNQLKIFTRCGMGPCQGRMCGTASTAVLAAARGVPEHEVDQIRGRFPIKPISVGQLASLHEV